MPDAILEFKNVSGTGRKFHLKDVNFPLVPGFIYAIAGKNGAGKTTLFHHILEEKTAYTGTILYQGEDIKNRHEKAMETIGFISEENTFFRERTCKQNAEILGLLYPDFDLALFLDTMKQLKLPARKNYYALSRGELMKFQLAFAIAHHSELYLLDEATAGMDPVFRIEFFDILRRLICDEKKCVLLTSHNESEIIKDTDYAAVMKDGVLSSFTESMEGINYE